jgi:hypothetical protein
MRSIYCIGGVIIFLSLFAGVPVVAGALAPAEILAKADEARGNLAGIAWEIKIVSMERGRTQERSLKVKAKSFNSLAEFVAPAKVKGQKILMRDRNMWFVKPGLRKPVPLSPRQKLMGQAASGDIASTNYAGDYKVAKMSQVQLDGQDCYLFDLVAASKKVTYDKIRYWVSKKRLVGMQAEFYTVSGKMFKSARFEYGNQVIIDGITRPFISQMTITNAVLAAEVTTMHYSRAQIKSIPEAAFNLNLLLR